MDSARLRERNCPLWREDDADGRAFVEFAFDLQFSAMQPDKAFGDG